MPLVSQTFAIERERLTMIVAEFKLELLVPFPGTIVRFVSFRSEPINYTSDRER